MSLAPQSDPTMEEILFSIHRTIPGEEPVSSQADLSGVLVLTEELEIKTEPALQTMATSPLTFDAAFDDNTTVTQKKAANADDESHLSLKKNVSVEYLFAKALTDTVEPAFLHFLSYNSAPIVYSMERLVREWLDDHFSALLEGVIRGEVEKIMTSRRSAP